MRLRAWLSLHQIRPVWLGYGVRGKTETTLQRVQLQLSSASIGGLGIFLQYTRSAIRRTTIVKDGEEVMKADIAKTFAVMPRQQRLCFMTLTILPYKMEYLARVLFDI